MRIGREHFPEATVERTRISVDRISASTPSWLALALSGVALAVADLGPAPLAVGAVVGCLGAYGLGRRDRSPDPRTGALVAQNERLQRDLDAAYLELLDAHGVAREPRPDQPGTAGREPRPSAGLRGGGRPGATAPAALHPLDAPLAGEAAGAAS